VIDARTEALLQEIVRRESRSFLQYIADSFPWTTSNEHAVLAKLQQLIAEECVVVAGLGRFLVRHHLAPPYLGPYPMEFTRSNFVALDFLLPRLVEEQRRAIVALEQDLSQLYDAEARAAVQSILDTKRRHLQTLEGLTASHCEPAKMSLT
jgi:hypothetical protein